MTTQDSTCATIVAFGDSITYGYQLPRDQTWVHLLGERLAEKLGRDAAPRIINSGVNGNTSREGLARIDADVLAHKPSLVFIEFGGNDTIEAIERHVTVEAFRMNLREMHRRITAAGGRVVFFSFPPVVEAWHPNGKDAHYIEAGGMDRYIQQYRDAARQVAEELNQPFYDFDGLIRRAAEAFGWEVTLERDGIHLTQKCNAWVAEQLAEPCVSWLAS